ncbi:hypothetical protein OKW30_004654 [Paraburkholderia sp. Clong3]
MFDWTSQLPDFFSLGHSPAAGTRYFLGSKSSTVSTMRSPGRARAFRSAKATMRLRPSEKALRTRASVAPGCTQKCCSSVSRVTTHAMSRPPSDSAKTTPSVETLGSSSRASTISAQKVVSTYCPIVRAKRQKFQQNLSGTRRFCPALSVVGPDTASRRCLPEKKGRHSGKGEIAAPCSTDTVEHPQEKPGQAASVACGLAGTEVER